MSNPLSSPASPRRAIALGGVEVDLAGHAIRRNGAPIRIGSRAFAILEALIGANGQLVTKEALLDAVWPDTIVGENTLQVHLSALRKALGAERNCIMTVPGRGYRLVKLAAARPAAGAAAAVAAPGAASRLPYHPDVVGRDAAVRAILASLDTTQVLTLTGPGGIGKTTLSIVAARRIEEQAPGSVRIVELAAMQTPAQVVDALEAELGVDLNRLAQGGDPAATFDAPDSPDALKLLLLDNAEHIVTVLAHVVERLMRLLPALKIVITSREPLRIGAERVFPVEPLSVPEPGASELEVLKQSAVRLFLLRIQATHRNRSHEAEISLIGEICRRLDGIPHAIELAAARVATLGVEGVHQRLSDRLALLSGGFRTALPRQQTLRATFDWSFAMLDAESAMLFRRLALFHSAFSLEAMCATACDAALTVRAVIDAIGELAAKSLVNIEFDGPIVHYRLSESTRAYAFDQLQASGEWQAIAERHARHLASFFRDEASFPDFPNLGEAHSLSPSLEDARSAADWALSPDGDPRLGIELTAKLVVALLDTSNIEECGRRAKAALAVLATLPADAVPEIDRIRLLLGMASTLPYLAGPIQRAEDAWHEVFDHARRTDNAEMRVRAYFGLWNVTLFAGKVDEAIGHARAFARHAQDDGQAWHAVLANQLLGIAEHSRGEHEAARVRLEAVVDYVEAHLEDADYISRILVDPRATSYSGLARIQWLQGRTEDAAETARQALNLIPAKTMEPWFTHVLGVVAIPLALISGDVKRARHYLALMQSQTSLHGLTIYQEFCEGLFGIVARIEGRVYEAATILEKAIDTLHARGFRRLTTPLVIEYAAALVALGRIDDAVARLDEARKWGERHGALYFMPEVLRALGIAAQAGAEKQAGGAEARARGLSEAREFFAQAAALGRAQGAPMWELRATLGLYRLPGETADAAQAFAALERLAPRFKAGNGAREVRELFSILGAGKPGVAPVTPNTAPN